MRKLRRGGGSRGTGDRRVPSVSTEPLAKSPTMAEYEGYVIQETEKKNACSTEKTLWLLERVDFRTRPLTTSRSFLSSKDTFRTNNNNNKSHQIGRLLAVYSDVFF